MLDEFVGEMNWPKCVVVAMLLLGFVGCSISTDWRAVEMAKIKSHEAGAAK